MNTATDEMHEDSLLPLKVVELKVGLKKSAIYERIKDNTFPKAVKVGSASRWSAMAIQTWIRQQLAANDAGVTS